MRLLFKQLKVKLVFSEILAHYDAQLSTSERGVTIYSDLCKKVQKKCVCTSKDSEAGESSSLGGRCPAGGGEAGSGSPGSGSLGRDFADSDREADSMLAPMERRAEPSVECPSKPRADASALWTVSPSLSEPSPDDEQDQLGNNSGGIPKLDPRVSRGVYLGERPVAGTFPDELKEVWPVFSTWSEGVWFMCVAAASDAGALAGAVFGAQTAYGVAGEPETPPPLAEERTAESALPLLPRLVEPWVEGVERVGLRSSWRLWESTGARGRGVKNS